MVAAGKLAGCALFIAVLGHFNTGLAVTAPAQHLTLQFTDPTVKAVAGGSGLAGAQGEYVMPYNLYLPADYDPNGPALPVILFLHGAGERGTDNSRQTYYIKYGLADYTQQANGPRAIVIAPQLPTGQTWNSINAGDRWKPGGTGISYYSETPAQQAARAISPGLQVAMDLLDSIQATERVDASRIYITGLSMGGFGTWDAITRFPNKFAAAMPLSGGGNVLAAPALVNEPIWAYHGTSDTTVYPNGSTSVIDAINAAGGTQAIVSLPAIGHQDWGVFYSDNPFKYFVGESPTTGGNGLYDGDNIYQWLFSQSLAPVPEPASLSLLVLGAAGLAVRCRKE